MSAARSKEKMAAAFRKLFRSSHKMHGDPHHHQNREGEGPASSRETASPASGSPARRLLNRHGYAVTPAETVPDAAGAAANAAAAGPPSNGGLFKKKSSNSTPSESDKGPSHQKTVRARRLMKELREIEKSQSRHDQPVFSVELVNECLFEWYVRIHRIDPESELAQDMRELSIPHILLHLTFPDNFPFAPPFMRVISPRIEKGFVMEGGAICMELLTPRGWASAYTVEAVVMQFAASIVKGQGRIAKKHKGTKDFNRRSAEESFRSLVKTHEKYGWVTPPLADG